MSDDQILNLGLSEDASSLNCPMVQGDVELEMDEGSPVSGDIGTKSNIARKITLKKTEENKEEAPKPYRNRRLETDILNFQKDFLSSNGCHAYITPIPAHNTQHLRNFENSECVLVVIDHYSEQTS
jgi:hypothetical protein